MKLFLFLFLLLAPLAAQAVAPASAPSCRSVTRSALGEHLRESVWEITHARLKLAHILIDHNKHCQNTRNGLLGVYELSKIEHLADEARRTHAELLDWEDEYLRTAQTAAEAARLLREDDCHDRILEERKRMESEMEERSQEVHKVLYDYCR